MQLSWHTKNFYQLSNDELYAIMHLRNEVFVVEQQCIFQDADNNDQKAYHILGYKNNELIAYSRLFAPGIIHEQANIGRVACIASYRGKGIGIELMNRSINACYQLFNTATIKIGAQLYLKNFYKTLGFIEFGEIYDEDGIPHVAMILTRK